MQPQTQCKKNKNFKEEMPWTKAQKVEFFCDYTKLAIKAYVGKSKVNSAKKCLVLLRRLWCLSVWANLASVDWRIFNFTFLCTNWLLDFEDSTEINRAWLHKDAKLAQPGRHQSRMQDFPCLILSGGNFFLLKYFCHSLCKPFLPRLPTLIAEKRKCLRDSFCICLMATQS